MTFLRKNKIAPYGLKCKINHKNFFQLRGSQKGARHLGKIPKKYRFFLNPPLMQWGLTMAMRIYGTLSVLVLKDHLPHRWYGPCCSLWNQLWQQTDLPVVDSHDGELFLEPLCRAADQSGHCHHGHCLHQEETKVESGFVLI